MNVAQFAPALVAATLPRAPRLGPLVLAAQLLDLAFYGLALAGAEHYAIGPWFTATSAVDAYDARWSHSLIGALGWGAGFALGYRLLGGGKDAAWVGAGVVVATWLIALLFDAPDLTLAGEAQRLGLGLDAHAWLAMPLALAAAALAFARYANHSRARDWRGRATLALFAAALLGFQLADWLAVRHTVAADPAPANVSLSGIAVATIVTVLGWWTGSTRRAA